MQRLAELAFRLRYASWATVLFGAAVLWATSHPIKFDQSIEAFFPADHPALRTYLRAKQAFGGDDIVFVAYEDEQLWMPRGMDRVRALAKALAENISAVARVEALDQMPVPWKVDAAAEARVSQPFALGRLLGGLSTVGGEVRAAAQKPEALAELRRRLCESPLFRNLLVDATGRTTALVVRLKSAGEADPKQAVRELRRHADAFANQQGLARVAVVGPPVLLADGFISLEKDNQTLGLVAMGLMALTMLLTVRNVWWAALPLVSGGTTWLVTQAFLNMSQMELTLSSGPIIAQTVVLCMPAASHLAMHFREALRRRHHLGEAAHETLLSVAIPVAWCAATAAAGYLALLSSSVRPVFQFGLVMAGCNVLAGLLTYLLAPGAMRPWRQLAVDALAAPPASQRRPSVAALTAWALRRPSRTLVLFLLPALAVATGIGQLHFESDYIKVYRSGSRVAKDYRYVEERMGGIGLVELVFPAPAKVAPEWIESLRTTAAELAAIDPQLVSQVLSVGDVLGPAQSVATAASRQSPDKPDLADKPRSFFGQLSQRFDPDRTAERVLETKLRVLSTPAYAAFLDNFWSRSNASMRLIVRIREAAAAERKERVFTELLARARSRLGEETYLTGLSHLMTQVTRAITTTQFQATAWSAALILLMLLLALRSVRLALMALLPTALAVGLVLGAMGWLGLRIDLSTALVASVAIGLSVDDTFHCLLRWKRELRSGHSPQEALKISYAGAGPGVVLSSLAVSLGFLALLFSEFVPTANFGWLVAVACLGGSLGNLVLLPACLARFAIAGRRG